MDKDYEYEVESECGCIDNPDYEMVLDPIMIGTDNLDEVCFNKNEFQRGLDEISYVCGMLTGLMNIGLNSVDALNYLVNIKVLENNIKVSEINKEASIDVAKETSLQIEKNSL